MSPPNFLDLLFYVSRYSGEIVRIERYVVCEFRPAGKRLVASVPFFGESRHPLLSALPSQGEIDGYNTARLPRVKIVNSSRGVPVLSYNPTGNDRRKPKRCEHRVVKPACFAVEPNQKRSIRNSLNLPGRTTAGGSRGTAR